MAPVRPVTDNYFGTEVMDGYRWMEEPGSAEFATWLKAQAEHADAVLGALPGRAELLARVRALDNAATSVLTVQPAGGRLFYLRVAPGEDSPKLYVREEGDRAPDATKNSPGRVLLDPERLGAKEDTHAAIDYFVPSPDGKRVAVGLSTGGSERSVLHVLDADDGRDLGEAIDRAADAEPCWRPDGRALFYRRLAQVAAAAPPNERYKNRRAYQHLLGTDPQQDTPLLAHGLTPGIDVGEDDKPAVFASPASPHALARVTHGISRELTLYSAPLSQLDGSRTPWRKVADVSDEITQADLHGDELFLLSHHGAARYQVLRVRLPAADLRTATTAVAASEVVLTQIRCAADALYVRTLDGGLGGVLRIPYEEPEASGERHDTPAEPSPPTAMVSAAPPPSVALPFAGAIWEVSADPLAPGVVFSLEGWVQAPVFLRYDPAAEVKVADTGLQPPSPVDCRDIESFEVKARAADGTLVPLSIVAKRGLVRDGSAPALLIGYGGYGVSIDPFFDPTRLAWLERGGVWAIAHVRGGGEYGEDWHQAGRKLSKPNSWGDFIACAEYLVQEKWTVPAHLAGMGGSAGGITVGRAITSRPELFGAAVIQAGVCNALRSETTPAGPPNVPEMGTTAEPAGFRGLSEMDAFHHVKESTAYPAVLLTAGINDPRVEPWQSAKMAARLRAASTSGKPVLLRVDYDAGHGLGSSRAQGQAEQADVDAFLLWQLGGGQKQQGSRQ